MSTVQFRKEKGIGYIALNREAALNSLNYEALSQLQDLINHIHVDPDVNVVMITGAGGKAFSAGADLKERKTLTESEVRRNVKAIQDMTNRLAALPQPTIAAVNGYALGGGFELMLACDFRIARASATMGLTETSWAIIPGAGGTQRLPRIVGEMKAKELILTAKKITAEEALDLGILLNVVEADDLLSTCEQLAYDILANGPVAVRQAKFAISEGVNTDLQTGLAIEAKAYELTIPTEDRVEALKAFSEKRAPRFKGR
ncbi:enoyl-CoA hydratase-related protein [Tenuibacillus multivorans]|uniref:Enoyl-CoA hydratase/carnithine racemase n=1 Tax=Tenuibacillus multivorans TaxID=237069 RepID=A0A1H0BVS2_9BACI|nr:enoyl-CoA hydratase-related protein [Tenuibacillus multivorans]GEL77016.1 putative enoyl-CoA hydratase/isomerase YngF [Tenuibacillus multivorans]SDN49693.1 Enoyl-CoA hydratase/carnithine racemase [Tenuibacillus multivorans]